MAKRSVKCLIAMLVIAPLNYIFLSGKLMDFLVSSIDNTRIVCIVYILYGISLQILGLGVVAYAYSILVEEINKKIKTE